MISLGKSVKNCFNMIPFPTWEYSQKQFFHQKVEFYVTGQSCTAKDVWQYGVVF